MRFRLVCRRHELVPFAFRLIAEKHDVVLCAPGCRLPGANVVERRQRPLPNEPVDAVLFAGADWGEYVADARRKEFHLIGASDFADLMEGERQYAEAVYAAMRVPAHLGPCKGDEPALVIWAQPTGDPLIAVASSYDRALTGDLGLVLPEPQGVAMRALTESCAAREWAGRFVAAMQARAHHGLAVVRLGEEAVLNHSFALDAAWLGPMCELVRGGLGALLAREEAEWAWPEQWALGVRVTVPPYPFKRLAPVIAEPIGYEAGMAPHLWPYDLYREGDAYMMANEASSVAIATARAATPKEAAERVARTIGNLGAPFAQYRLDVGKGAGERCQAVVALEQEHAIPEGGREATEIHCPLHE